MILNASYTLSWSLRRYDEFGTDWFNDKFDNRNKLNIVWRYNINKYTSVYASWNYHSGNRMTLPSKSMVLPSLPGDADNKESQYVYEKPNNISMPAYHRLDLGANFRHITKHGNERIWNVSLYNVYCHLNSMYVKIHQDDNGNYRAKCRGYVPIIPSVSYTLKF